LPEDFPEKVNLFSVNFMSGSVTSGNEIVTYNESARWAHFTGAIFVIFMLFINIEGSIEREIMETFDLGTGMPLPDFKF
jgi:hypothetical protein